MAKIVSKVMWWSSVDGADKYYVRVLPLNSTFNYDSVPTSVVAKTTVAEVELDLKTLSLAEGNYDIYVTAVDEVGNESDPLEYASTILDFTPPSKPSSGGFRS